MSCGIGTIWGVKWEEGMMEEAERIQRHSIDFCLFHQERREDEFNVV